MSRHTWALALASVALCETGCNPQKDFQTYCNETWRCPDSGVADGGSDAGSCSPNGVACAVGTGCCSGNCLGVACAPAGACFDGGETCEHPSDCCGGGICQGTCRPAGSETLSFTNAGGTTAAAGVCSAPPAGIQLLDSSGRPIEASVDLVIALSSTSPTLTFSTDGCSSSVGTVTLKAGQTGTPFAFEDTHAGAPTVTASSMGFSPISQQETVVAGPPGQLVFRDHPLASAAVGKCSTTPQVVRVEDLFGNPTVATAALSFALSEPSGQVSFFPNNCTTPGALFVGPGNSSGTFVLLGQDAGVFTVTLDAGSGMSGDTSTVGILGLDSPSLRFTSGASLLATAGVCATATVGSFFPDGGPLTQGSSLPVQLTPVAGVTYYSDNVCGAAGDVSIASGASTRMLSLMGTTPTPAPVTVLATATNYFSASLQLQVDAGIPASISVTPSLQDFAVGDCPPSVFALFDAFGSPTTFSSSQPLSCTFSSGLMFSTPQGSGCTPLGSATFPAGTSSASFNFVGSVGTYTGTCTAAGATSEALTEVVDAGVTQDGGCGGLGSQCMPGICCAGLSCVGGPTPPVHDAGTFQCGCMPRPDGGPGNLQDGGCCLELGSTNDCGSCCNACQSVGPDGGGMLVCQ